MEAIDHGWRKSSHSGNGGECVEVAAVRAGAVVAVRDSKHPHGPVLIITPDEWTRFIAGLRTA